MHLSHFRPCLKIRGSKRNIMRMRANFLKFYVNSRTIGLKFEGDWGHFHGIAADSSIFKQALIVSLIQGQ